MNHMNKKILLISLVAIVAFAALGAGLMAQSSTQPIGADAANRQKRFVAAKRTYELLVEVPEKVSGHTADAEETYRWSVRWMEAEQATTTDLISRRSAREAHVKRMQELEKHVKQKYQAGEVAESDVAAAEFYRADAEN